MYLPGFIKNLIYTLTFGYFLYSIYSTAYAIYESSKKTEEIIHKKEALISEKEELKNKLQVINTDEFVEKEARTKLNMKKEGEELYLIPNNTDENSKKVEYQETLNYVMPIEETSNIEKWFKILF
jgi:cell division protein FtsB